MKRKAAGWRRLAAVLILALCLPAMDGIRSQAASRPALLAKKLTLKAGEKAKLKVRKVKKKKIKSLRFSSNKKKVAKVNAKGQVTAKKAGSAKITCKVTLKNKKKYKLVCKVKVLKANGTSGAGKDTDNGDPNAGKPTTEQPTASVQPQNPGTASGPGTETDPGTTVGPGTGTDPGTTAGPGTGTDPGTTSDPGTGADPGTTSSPGTTTNPGTTEAPKRTPRPLVIPTVQPSTVETVDDGQMRENMTAFDFQHEMGMGINLGNTLESITSWGGNSDAAKYETAWGSPVITQTIIHGMRQAGFRSIRIPVAWSNMMSDDGTYAISNAYFTRVEEIMDYAFQEGMYVIVNIHYDGGWWARFGSKEEAERIEAMNQFKSMWTQIATRFNRYSDHLIFESANEELGDRLNSTDDYKNSGYYSNMNDLYTLTNTINQTFVDIVRETGGNNASRYLLIAGYNTDIGKTCDARFQMPDDSLPDHLMISIHYYSPSTYCLVDNELNTWGYRDSWGTEADAAAMKSELNNMKVCFVDKGVPVVIGEYGGACLTKTNGTYVKKAGRTLFYKTLCEYALTYGMCPVLWDIQITEDASMGIYDRLTARITDSAEAAMFMAMEQFGEEAAVYEPPARADRFVWNGEISCKGWNPGTPVADLDDSNFVMNQDGGCYKISGIEWSAFSHPVLKMHADMSAGSASCWLAKGEQVNMDNPNWHYIDDKKVKKTGDWTFSQDVVYDLSALQLTDTDDLYLCLKSGTDFEGRVTFTVMEKE